jgi:hypothetical protein
MNVSHRIGVVMCCGLAGSIVGCQNYAYPNPSVPDAGGEFARTQRQPVADDRNAAALERIQTHIREPAQTPRQHQVTSATALDKPRVLPMGAVSLEDRRGEPRRFGATDGYVPTVEWVSISPVQSAPVAVVDVPPPTSANTATLQRPVHQAAPSNRLSELEKAVQQDPNDIDQQIQLRYLYLAEGRTAEALATPVGMDSAKAQTLMTWIEAMLDGERVVRAGDYEAAGLQGLEALRRMADAKAELTIPRIELCSAIHSYGRFEVIPERFLTAGGTNRAFVYCEVRHFDSEGVKGSYRTRIAHRLELLDNNGQVVWQDPQFVEVVDECRNRRTDFFFNRLWEMPGGLAAGEYVLNVIVEDRIKAQVTEAKHRIELVAPFGTERTDPPR